MTFTIIGAGSTTAGALIPMLLEETDAKLHLVSGRPIDVVHPRVSTDTIDITDRAELKRVVMPQMPSAIINTAAMTNVDACEADKKLAWTLNVTLVENLIRVARVADAHLVHFSTDYVFDGEKGPYTESDIPSPINYYGKSKLAGENALAIAGIESTVIRTNVVYGPLGPRPDFVRWVLQALDEQRSIKVVTDQYSNPTYVDDLAEAVITVIERSRTGLYHVGGADYLSRYEFAVKIAELFKVDPSIIEPVTTGELGQAARRPVRGGLVTLKAESDLRMKFRGVESGLVSYRHALFSEHLHPTQRKLP
jgi:dTDP-4-dehydrorhamnose reductase